MEYIDMLSELRRRLTFPGACECSVSVEDAEMLLNASCGQLDRASYEGCLRNAENSALTLPDVSTESLREYWLSLARHYRPNGGALLTRADEGRCGR